jgi:hypothetical protein
MIDSPSLRPSLGGNLATPSKEPTIQVSGGEENQPINRGDQNRRLSSKRSLADVPTISKNNSLLESRPDKRIRPMDLPEVGSDCDTEVSSTVSSTVTARQEWLKDFGKQHNNTFPQKAPTTRSNTTFSAFRPSAPTASVLRTPPPKSSRDTMLSSTHTESAASTLVNRMMMSEPPKRRFAPGPSKPRVHTAQVQATNDGYASVAKLSQWLENDPTSTKKKKHVRRGKNVITKSRQFEKDLEDVIIIETNLPRGNIKHQQKLIQGALRDEGRRPIYGSPGPKNMLPRYAMSEAGVGTLASHISVSKKKDWLKKAFKTAVEEVPKTEDESRSEIVTNDAASSLSVSDKKDWLKHAFKKNSSSAGQNKAMTDVMHNRGGEDVASNAKRRFLERSRRTPTKSTPQPKQAPERSNIRSPTRPHKEDPLVRDLAKEERTGPPDAVSVVEAAATSDETLKIEQDQTPVDFRAARQAVLQRGKQNGHKMQVVNKVYMKTKKFENFEKQHRQSSDPHGLLKSSWEEADPTTGAPTGSTSYDKKYLPDIAPKKSFEELP